MSTHLPNEPSSTTTIDRSQEVLIALRRIIQAIYLHSKRMAKDFGLTTPQIILLKSIKDMGEVTIGQLSHRVSLSQGTVTTIIDRLEERGLVERYRSTTDRRVVHARLTDQGQQILQRSPPLLQERFMQAFSALDPIEQGQIIDTLECIVRMMGADRLTTSPLLDIDINSSLEYSDGMNAKSSEE